MSEVRTTAASVLPLSKRWALSILVALALFLETLDITILTTAVPSIARDMGVRPLTLKLALTSYLFSLALFIPLSGWLARRFGTQRVFTAGIACFSLGSWCCGMARQLSALVLARILQGMGGAVMMPVGRLILLKALTPEEFVLAASIMTIPALLGPALGPLFGGLIVTYVHWRWIFWVNLPFGLLGTFLAWRWVPNQLTTPRPSFDASGWLRFITATLVFTVTIELFSENVLSSGVATGLFLFALLAAVGYVHYAKRAADPVLDIKLFRVRTFRITILTHLCCRFAAGGLPFLLPMCLQLGLKYSPLQSGQWLCCFALAMMLMKPLVQPLLRRYGFRRVMGINALLFAAAIASFATVTPNTSSLLLALRLIWLGLCLSLQFTCMNVLGYVDLSEADMPHATSFIGTTQQLSTGVGVAIVAVLLYRDSAEAPLQLLDFQYTFLTLALILLSVWPVLWSLTPQDGMAMRGEREL